MGVLVTLMLCGNGLSSLYLVIGEFGSPGREPKPKGPGLATEALWRRRVRGERSCQYYTVSWLICLSLKGPDDRRAEY
jgi:hypothetical protein